MDKKGILIVSFGTSYRETELKTIVPIQEAVRQVFPDFQVRGAFTSRIIIKKLAGEGRVIPTPEEAAQEMLREGFTHVIVQPLHFLHGHEYHRKILTPLDPFRERFAGFAVGEPLVTDEKDYDYIVEIISMISQTAGGEKLLLMGHGTDHPADRMYSRLQQKLDERGIDAAIATVEGTVTLEDVLPRLDGSGATRVHLVPLMLVAGDHATNDMAGNEPESWKSILESKGIRAIPHMQGMGEFLPLRRIVINHIRASRRALFPERYERMQAAAKRKKMPVPREKIPWFPTIDPQACSGCGICYLFCPKEVYSYDRKRIVASVTSPYSCVVNCSRCSGLCPTGAISFPGSRVDIE